MGNEDTGTIPNPAIATNSAVNQIRYGLNDILLLEAGSPQKAGAWTLQWLYQRLFELIAKLPSESVLEILGEERRSCCVAYCAYDHRVDWTSYLAVSGTLVWVPSMLLAATGAKTERKAVVALYWVADTLYNLVNCSESTDLTDQELQRLRAYATLALAWLPEPAKVETEQIRHIPRFPEKIPF